MKVGITLLTCNRLDWTKECIRTLEKNTPRDLYTLTVVDNGSTDGTVEYLSALHCRVLLLGKNVGVAKSRNLSIHASLIHDIPDYICFIHNDMLFPKDWLQLSLNQLIPRGKNIVLGISNIIGEQLLFYSDELKDKIANASIEDKTEIANLEPRFYPASIFRDIGFLDESYDQSECEDVDYNIRISNSKYKLLATNNASVFHALGLVRTKLPDNESIRRANLDRCVEKYGKELFNKYNYARRSTFYFDNIPYLRYGV